MPKKMTLDEFNEKLNKKYNGKLTCLSTEYINNKSPLIIKCNDCGYIREISANKVLTDSCCPSCSGKLKYNNTTFMNQVKLQRPDDYFNYELIGTYINNSTPVKMKHKTCGHIWDCNPGSFLYYKTKCPKCSHPSRRKDPNDFKLEFDLLFGSEYELLSDYVTNKTKILVKCKKCGEIFKVDPIHILSDKYINCRNCHSSLSNSVGVKKIKKFLNDNNIEYITEKTFLDFKSKAGRCFRYDILIPKYNLIIEYDGEDHFNWHPSSTHNKTEDDLLKRRQYDILKDNYIRKSNSYCLLRISYKELNKINEILYSLIINKSSTTIIENNLLYVNKHNCIYNKDYYDNRSTLKKVEMDNILLEYNLLG